eukprot:352580-Chlamydomonas_euryale.AAC.3
MLSVWMQQRPLMLKSLSLQISSCSGFNSVVTIRVMLITSPPHTHTHTHTPAVAVPRGVRVQCFKVYPNPKPRPGRAEMYLVVVPSPGRGAPAAAASTVARDDRPAPANRARRRQIASKAGP